MRLPFLALALVLLAGCQPIPHPFAYQAGSPGLPALRPRDSFGVVVLPVVAESAAGAPAEQPLTDALVKGLVGQDVPASSDAGNRGSFHLSSTIAAAPASADKMRVTLDWDLADAAGKIVGSGSAESETTPAAWRGGDGALATALAGDAVPKIVGLLTRDAPPPSAPVAAAAALVSVGGVSGAPGDGNTSLARAIALTLGRAGIAVGSGNDAPFTLTCAVEVGPVKADKQQVQIHWQLSRRGGAALGHADQQNAVPAGSLDGAWADIAYAVAAAAAPGIADLVHKAEPLLADEAPLPAAAPPQASPDAAAPPQASPTVAVAAAPITPPPATTPQPQVATAIPAPPPAPRDGAQFLVQFGAYRDEASGAKNCTEAAKLAPAHLVRSERGEPVWYRCRTDAPLSRAGANALIAAASSAGQSAILVALPPQH